MLCASVLFWDSTWKMVACQGCSLQYFMSLGASRPHWVMLSITDLLFKHKWISMMRWGHNITISICYQPFHFNNISESASSRFIKLNMSITENKHDIVWIIKWLLLNPTQPIVTIKQCYEMMTLCGDLEQAPWACLGKKSIR